VRDLPDHHDDKWWYSEHAAAKHEILRRYLGAWLSILAQSRDRPRLILLDGFAGRGRYMGGEPGSPVIMFERAVQVVDEGRARDVWIRCAEANRHNFSDHLEQVCAGLHHPGVKVVARREEFVEAADALASWAEGQRRPPPIFVMADPFGFSGVSLDTIRRLMQLPRAEVLVTFMAESMNRFYGQPHADAALTAFFGGHAWRRPVDGDDRSESLLLTYRRLVVPAVARRALAFRVFRDDRRSVLYYLVHLTNNDKGMREMKRAMVAQSGDMTFWPVTLRPPAQLELDTREQPPYRSLQRHLVETYAGRELTFEMLLNDDYPDGVWIEKQYRAALKAMEKEDPGRVSVTRPRTTESGRPPSGIKYVDRLRFN
jgi:three-Cys-motif partner protein